MDNNVPIINERLVQCPALLPTSHKKALAILAEKHGMTRSQIVRLIILKSVGEMYPEYEDIHTRILQVENTRLPRKKKET